MALVRKTNNQRNSGWAAAASLFNALMSGGGTFAPSGGDYTPRYTANYLNDRVVARPVGPSEDKWRPGGSGNPPAGNGRKGNNQRRRRGKEKRQNLSSGDVYRQIGFGPTSGTPSLRTTLTGVFELVTPATGVTSAHRWIGNITNGLFTILSADSVKLLTAFEKGVVHSVMIKFVGTPSSTTSGYLALGMDSSTDTTVSTAPTTLANLTDRCTHVVTADVKGEATLVYRPKGTDREVRLADNAAAATETLAGRFMYYAGGHNIPASTSFGLLYIAVEITLQQ